MANFAIIETGGKQIRIKTGDEIWIEKLDKAVDDEVIFENILMVDEKIGRPLIDKARVRGKVIKQGRHKKITIFKYRPKKHSHTKQGHRQDYTKVLIEEISATGKFVTKTTANKKTDKPKIATAKVKNINVAPVIVPNTTGEDKAEKMTRPKTDAAPKPAIKKSASVKKTAAAKPIAEPKDTTKKTVANKTTIPKTTKATKTASNIKKTAPTKPKTPKKN